MPVWTILIAAMLTVGGFWLIDQTVRHQRWLRRIPKGKGATSWARFGLLVVLAVLASVVVDWRSVESGSSVRILVLVLAIAMTWKHVTQDIDVAIRESLALERVLLIASCAAAWRYPALLLPWLFLVVRSFGGWKHHGTIPLRMLMLFLGGVYCVVLPLELLSANDSDPMRQIGVVVALLFLMIVCQASHYVVPAIGKIRLGPKWWSWAIDNRLHAVAAGAYSWGWARFLSRETAARVLRILAPLDRPLQIVTIVLELGSILNLFHPMLLAVVLIGLSLMHIGIFLSTGILFWEWIVVNATVVTSVFLLDPAIRDLLFNPVTGLLGVLFVLALPARGLLWKAVNLAWWDTPFTQRIHWDVVGTSGRVYGLYNDFMCPHERLYGRVHGYFMTSERIVTYHLGEIYPVAASSPHRASKAPFEPYVAHELRDLVRRSKGDAVAIGDIKARFGAVLEDAAETEEHAAYLRRFFRALNDGAWKFILPRGLRWLKAPGGQYYYWGEKEAFRGQERAERVIVRYREEFFDGVRFSVVKDVVVREIVIGEGGGDEGSPFA